MLPCLKHVKLHFGKTPLLTTANNIFKSLVNGSCLARIIPGVRHVEFDIAVDFVAFEVT
jgi:hypothetical protein